MEIIRDSDTVEFIDASGDKLYLLRAPRRADVLESDEIARKEAMRQLNDLKASGMVTDADIQEAQQDPEAVAIARERLDAEPEHPAVRALRFKAIAVKLVIGGEAIGGAAVAEAYESMFPASLAWVDACVADVWEKATKIDTQGSGADAALPGGEAISATA